MPKLLKPSDFAARLRKGETRDQIFVDGSGGYKAKLIGLQAGTEVIAGEDRSVGFVISSNALDRYNSTIAIDGWQTEAFERNPVVLWAHDDSIPAIARASKPTADKKALRSIATFADRDTHPLADTVFRLIKGKFIGAASVGWIPIRYQFVEDGDRGFGVDYLEQELLEWSVVNIPANPECLVGARSMGIDTKPLLQWAERTLDQAGTLLIPRKELEALRKAAGSPTVARPIRRVARKMKRSDGDWKCGAAQGLAIVEDDSWDGPAVEKAIFAACDFDGDKPDTAKARQAFLAYDASAPEKRGSYKLPFAKMVDGELKASAAGIRAAASRLSQTDIPQSVRDEGRKVLDHYEAKMGDGDKAFAASAAALKTLFVNRAIGPEEFADRLIVLAKEMRAGRVLSEENENTLRAAHECMRMAQDYCTAAVEHHTKARDHIMSVIEQNRDPQNDDPDDDDTEDPEDDETETDEERSAREQRERRVRLLKLTATA